MQIKSERLIMRIKKTLFVATVLVLLCAFGLSAAGQTTGGAVTGKVVDAQGAAIPNATVKLLDKEKGQTLTTQTTDTGSYNFPNVAVGDYTISFENTGFAPAKEEVRSEEHTSELQSRSDLVCRLLLEKKKKKLSYDFCIRSQDPSGAGYTKIRCSPESASS